MEGFEDLGFARVDVQRAGRTGDPEVVYGAGKTVEQAVAIVRTLRDAHPERAALVTRAAPELSAALRASFDGVTADDEAGCVAVGPLPPVTGTVCVVAAGTSDGPVAAEAAFTARVSGARSPGSPTSGWPGSTGCSPSGRAWMRPTAWSSSPAWTARCRARSAG